MGTPLSSGKVFSGKVFSGKDRPIHLGVYPLETLARTVDAAAPADVPDDAHVSFAREDRPESIVNAMRDHQAMLDAIRDGMVNKALADCPDDPLARADHLKAFGYFTDASLVGVSRLTADAMLDVPRRNPDIDRLAHDLRTRQTKTLASGIDMIMADLKESMSAPPSTIENHEYALVFLHANPRAPAPGEAGTAWIEDALPHRSCLLAAESAVVIANYLRLLGYDSRAHTGTTSDVCLNRLAFSAGLATLQDGELQAPWIGTAFGLSAVTTTFELSVDSPLAPLPAHTGKRGAGRRGDGSLGDSRSKQGGRGVDCNAHMTYAKRRFVDGAHPFETLKRVDRPTTFIDEERVARVPKRTDMFARAQFGDMGKNLQEGAKGGHYVRKSAPSMAQRRALGAFALLQDGDPIGSRRPIDPTEATERVKATAYFLGIDAVGVSRCPDWAWYSHDATARAIDPPHDQAISMIVDQGFSSMEGSSGDDWISVALSMRAYLRFSLLGGVLARQLRNLGYSAKAHSVIDGDVLQPPLLLLSGLGEVSRIGEVILNPFLGPRLKSGVVTTDLPLAHDKPIDFGLQTFCEHCNKCARECPAGAITAGPKLMFNGYEIWKSDSQKCATYRITTPGGAMCGRCMKTCPWNMEGILADAAFRQAAMKLPRAAPLLAKLDDLAGRGNINPVKKWWWDLEIKEDGGYRAASQPVNERTLQHGLKLRYEDQTLAVYPASLAPHPWPYPFHMDREKGIAAYEALIPARVYRKRLAEGDTERLAHEYVNDTESPVLHVRIDKAESTAAGVTRYDLRSLDGSDLPAWEAGAHLDIVVAPEFLRQYSMCGDPADCSVYRIGVLREQDGRGGSALLHRIFEAGRKIFISKPINHFPLVEQASMTYLMGGGIGVTPMIAMAHRLHAINGRFELHYSGRSRDAMGFLDELADYPWADSVQLHVSSETGRADFGSILRHQAGAHAYTCGAEPYMKSVTEAAATAGFTEEQIHLEYFSVPEVPDYVNHPFTLRLQRSGRELSVPADRSAADVLIENGIHVDLKCADGICGVCKCGLVSGAVEHRDHVLSGKQRANRMILCQSRAADDQGVITIDL